MELGIWSESIGLLVCLFYCLYVFIHSIYLGMFFPLCVSLLCYYSIPRMGIILGLMVHDLFMMGLALLNWAIVSECVKRVWSGL